MSIEYRLSKGGSRRIYEDVHGERIRAHRKHKPHGPTMEQRFYDNPDWLPVVGEEFGEVCRALCEMRHAGGWTHDSILHLREELIQTAAMVCAWVSAVDEEIELWGVDDDEA